MMQYSTVMWISDGQTVNLAGLLNLQVYKCRVLFLVSDVVSALLFFAFLFSAQNFLAYRHTPISDGPSLTFTTPSLQYKLQ